jgi:hypothetical protein
MHCAFPAALQRRGAVVLRRCSDGPRNAPHRSRLTVGASVQEFHPKSFSARIK